MPASPPAALRHARRIVNGAVAGVLRSRAHRLLSRWLLLLAYRGRRTGRRYEIPLLYARDGADLLLVALHPDGQSWWRNLRDAVEVELLLGGRAYRGRARLEPAEAEAQARALYVTARPWTGPFLRRAPARFVRVHAAEGDALD